MVKSLQDYNKIFFIGIAGTGMSALAQYVSGMGKQVSGSDRFFVKGQTNETKEKLEHEGIPCFPQDGSGINDETSLVIVSTAIEPTVPEVQLAIEKNIPIIKRSELLAMVADAKRTIAIGGTSGKSTTAGMLFQIMKYAGYNPGIITGAGLINIMEEGKIGNAAIGGGEWLIIEADESDGSIVQYHPETGLLLNVDKDHQEIEELMDLFGTFSQNSKSYFICNRSNKLAAKLSRNASFDFASTSDTGAGYISENFVQVGMQIRFQVQSIEFRMNVMGKHNMENALAAIAVANRLGIEIKTCAEALETYKGIYRRHQILGSKNGITVIDDYAHNPVKCAASIEACQPVAPKVLAWFQPHGYGPTRFLKDDFIKEIAGSLRPEDEIWMSEIYYAGGTAVKDISANDLIEGIKALGKKAIFVANRNEFLETARAHLTTPAVLLLMGARDPSLEEFSHSVWKNL